MQLPTNFEDIKNLELLAHELVDGFIIGLHKSPYHGFSIEFAEHRQYQNGDALKHVDWKVYGRKDVMFTKKYDEETNLRCLIGIDISGSMHFPTEGLNKIQHSCIGAAALITLLRKQLDAFYVQTLAGSTHENNRIKFSATNMHFKQQLTKLQQIALSKHQLGTVKLSDQLHEIANTIHQRALIVLFTDIPYQELLDQSLTDSLLHLKYRKHELIIFHLLDDKKEILFDYKNEPVEFEDLETGKTVKLFPNVVKEQYQAKVTKYKNEVTNFCLNNKIDLIPYNLTQTIHKILIEYLQKRSKLM